MSGRASASLPDLGTTVQSYVSSHHVFFLFGFEAAREGVHSAHHIMAQAVDFLMTPP